MRTLQRCCGLVVVARTKVVLYVDSACSAAVKSPERLFGCIRDGTGQGDGDDLKSRADLCRRHDGARGPRMLLIGLITASRAARRVTRVRPVAPAPGGAPRHALRTRAVASCQRPAARGWMVPQRRPPPTTTTAPARREPTYATRLTLHGAVAHGRRTCAV